MNHITGHDHENQPATGNGLVEGCKTRQLWTRGFGRVDTNFFRPIHVALTGKDDATFGPPDLCNSVHRRWVEQLGIDDVKQPIGSGRRMVFSSIAIAFSGGS